MRLYSIEEAARILDRSAGYIRQLIAEQKLQTVTWKNHVLIVANDDSEEEAA
jgi:hypothetical protein